MRSTSFRRKILSWLLIGPGLALAQTPQPKGTLAVKGFPGRAPVIQVNGKSYVEVESLARITNGALTFQTNQVTLTLGAPPAPTPPPAPPEPPAKLSKDLLRAGVEALSVVEEWRTAVVGAIQNNSPLTEDWADGRRRNMESKLALASTTAVTDADRNVLQLLRNEANNMQKFSDKYVAMRKSLSFISPDSLDGDPLNQQIQSCAQGLTSLTAGGQFQDVATCR